MEHDFDKREMGRRLSIARKMAGKEAVESAKVIGIPESALASVELGISALSVDEIESLAEFYETSFSRLLCHDAVHTALALRYRKHSNANDVEARQATNLLRVLFSAETELEHILGIQHKTNYPNRIVIGNKGIKSAAVEHANSLREFLGLGDRPIEDIFSVIEKKIGIRLYQQKLGKNSKISGIYGYGDGYGYCILLNGKYSRPSRNVTAAHELGHFMFNRSQSELDGENCVSNAKEERYARNFSYAFAMPESSFSESFNKMSNNSNELTKELVIRLADMFHVTRYACVRQIEEYGLAKNAIEWLKFAGKMDADEKNKILGPDQFDKRYARCDDSDRIVPHHIGLMAYEAWKKTLLSEGQISSMLDLDRIEVRKLLNEMPNVILTSKFTY